MKPVSRIRAARKITLLVGDLVILFACLAGSLAWRQPELLQFDVVMSFVPLFGIWVAAFYVVGLYEFRLIRNFVSLVGGVSVSAAACLVLGATYFYVTVPYLQLTPKMHLFVTITAAHALLLWWRRASLLLFKFSLLDLKLVILADADHREYLSASIPDRLGEWLALTEDVEAKVDLVVVDHGWVEANPEKATKAFSTALACGVPVVSLDEFYEAMFGKVSPLRAGDLAWALTHVLPRSGSLYFKIKRLLDVVTAFVLLALLSPLLVGIALLIRLVDRVEPVYRQTRVGHLGRVFVLYKFQTMRPGAEQTGPFTPGPQAGGVRATQLGMLLRRTRVDELPQLWNVLRGEMSIVGPRPEWIKEVEILERVMPTYHLRHLVPPGITGWAQVYYRATSDLRDSIEKHHYDLYYVKHFSLALDLSIALKTVKRVFLRDSGVSSERYPHQIAPGATDAKALDITSVIGRG